ncbi:ABC transporter permease [Leptolyngbya sp. AN02str]|uniref:ABC transporter permease n=1 Tax=Leptolyngbya sp. AN02str TaxID=3423363 RepID=UPI003D310290
MVQRDLRSHYTGTALGSLWPIVRQLSQLLIFTYVFSVVLQVRLSAQGLPSQNQNLTFGLWLFAGLLPWTAVTGAFIQGATAVIRQKNLVTKVVFPLMLLPAVPVLSAFVESTFGLAILIAFVAVLTQKIHLTLLLLPLAWIPQLLLTAGLTYAAAALSVFLRDIPQAIGIVLNIWFYATPIIYPASLIPQPIQKLVLWFNPMAAVAELYRDIILIGEIQHWREWLFASGISLVIFVGGLWIYRKLRPAFADVL